MLASNIGRDSENGQNQDQRNGSAVINDQIQVNEEEGKNSRDLKCESQLQSVNLGPNHEHNSKCIQQLVDRFECEDVPEEGSTAIVNYSAETRQNNQMFTRKKEQEYLSSLRDGINLII